MLGAREELPRRTLYCSAASYPRDAALIPSFDVERKGATRISIRTLVAPREENLSSISQTYILGKRHRDFFDAVRAGALAKKGSIKRPSAPEHIEDPVVGVLRFEFRHDLSFLPCRPGWPLRVKEVGERDCQPSLSWPRAIR